MNKILTTFAIISIAFTTQCAPPPPPYCPPPPPHHHCHDHHRSEKHFWSGMAGSFVGTILGNAVANPVRETTVVAQPVVVQQPVTVISIPTPSPVVVVKPSPKQVWVEGHYQEKIVNGVIVKEWIPGHFEVR